MAFLTWRAYGPLSGVEPLAMKASPASDVMAVG